jgi:hypothetical protein
MAQRIPNPAFRVFSVSIEDAPAGLTEDRLRELIEGAIRDTGSASVVVKPKAVPRKVTLRARHIRKAGTFPCTQKVAGIKGVGCGRSFSSEKNRDRHMDLISGIWADKTRWPNGCLDAIVTPDVRDDR